MAIRGFAQCLGLIALASATAAQSQPATETLVPVGRPAQSITGRVTLLPNQLTFENGKSLALAHSGQTLFRPEKKKPKIIAELYRVTQPDNPALENGSTLCRGKSIAYLLFWKSQRVANETDPRTMIVFSGSKFDAGSADECGRYTYDAGGH